MLSHTKDARSGAPVVQLACVGLPYPASKALPELEGQVNLVLGSGGPLLISSHLHLATLKKYEQPVCHFSPSEPSNLTLFFPACLAVLLHLHLHQKIWA